VGLVGSVIWWVGLGWIDENRPTDNSEPNRGEGIISAKPRPKSVYELCQLSPARYRYARPLPVGCNNLEGRQKRQSATLVWTVMLVLKARICGLGLDLATASPWPWP